MNLKGKNVRVRGLWWHYQFESNGEIYSGTTGLEGVERLRTAAEHYAEAKRRALQHPSPSLAASDDPRHKRFPVAVEQFLTWARNVEYRAKPSTAERLKVSMASCSLYFADRHVREIDPAAVEGYKQFRIEEHKVRDVTVRHDLHALSVFFRYSIKMGWSDRNPVKDVKIPSDRDSVREHVVTPEEEEKYLAAAATLHQAYRETRPGAEANMRDLAILMLELGARPEELLAVRLADIDLQAGTLLIAGGKTRAARRMLNLTSRSKEVIAWRMVIYRDSAWLFPSDRRPGMHVTKLQCTHDRICREAGVCFVIYDFRHTFATRAIAAGVDVPTVAAILGHSGLRVIYRYVHPTAGQQKRAMELMEAAANRQRIKVVG